MTNPMRRAQGGTRGPVRGRRAAGLVKVVAASAAVVLLAAGGIWAFTRGSTGSSGMQAVASVDLAAVEEGSFSISTTSMGELEAKDQIELRSKLDSRADIVEIVPEGSVAKAGDVLIRLNTDSLQDDIDQQMLEVERAMADVVAAENALKIQISENESREREGMLAVELAELALQQWENGEVIKTRAKQKLEIEQAERDMERLQERFERTSDLLAQGFATGDQHKSDEISMVNAEDRYQTAILDQQTYENYQFPRDEKTKESDVAEAKADLERIRTQNDINAAAKQSSLETTRRQGELKQQRLDKLREQFELATIRAPSGGLVVYATSMGDRRGDDDPLEVGREVRPNELLILLPDTSALVASVRVHESLAGRVRPGQFANVKVDAIGGEVFPGIVESIGVLAESGGWRDPNRREYTVRIAVQYNNESGDLKPSMRAEAEIVMGEVDNTLMAPVQSIFSEGPVRYVYTPNGARFERQPVKVGQTSDTWAEIEAGLAPGQSVLLREPDAGEIVSVAWDTAELEAAGVAVDEEGNPVAVDSRREMMMRMMQQRGGSGNGAAGWSGQRAGQGASGRPSGGQRPQGAGQGSSGERPAGAQGQRPEGQRPGTGGEQRSAPTQGGEANASGTPATDASAPPSEPTESE